MKITPEPAICKNHQALKICFPFCLRSFRVVKFGDGAALVDAGCGPGHDQLVSNISQCLPDAVRISHLLLTHCHYDHTGGAAAVKHHYNCEIVAHALDAVFIESFIRSYLE